MKLLKNLLVCCLFIPFIVNASATFVQENGSGQSTSGTSLNGTVTAGTSGNVHGLVILVDDTGSQTDGISTITQTNVTWTKRRAATRNVGSFGALDIEIWTGVISGGSSGTTVTMTWTGTPSEVCWDESEYSGTISTTADGDGFADDGGGAGTSVNSNGGKQAITTVSNDWILTAVGYAGGSTHAPSIQPGGSYSNLTAVNGFFGSNLQVNYSLTNTIGNQSPTWTLDTASRWVSAVQAVKLTSTAIQIISAVY